MEKPSHFTGTGLDRLPDDTYATYLWRDDTDEVTCAAQHDTLTEALRRFENLRLSILR